MDWGRWVVGLIFIAIVGGGFAAYFTREFFLWLGEARPERDVPVGKISWIYLCKLEAFTGLLGALERSVIVLIAVIYPATAIVFSMVWMGLKLASNWNRPDRPMWTTVPNPTADQKKQLRLEWKKVARGALSGLSASLVSAAFGVCGGLYIRNWQFAVG